MKITNLLFFVIGIGNFSYAAETLSKTVTAARSAAPVLNIVKEPVVPNKNPATPPKNLVPIDRIMVEKVFKVTRFSYFLFEEIKKALNNRQLSDAKKGELTAKIYWEIMSEYAQVFRDAKLTSANLDCLYEAYNMPEATPFKSVLSIQNYAKELSDVVLKKKTWPILSEYPTTEQVAAVMLGTSYAQHLSTFLARILVSNKLPIPLSETKAAYDRALTFYQFLLSQKGSNKQSLQKFLDKIRMPACGNLKRVEAQYTEKRGRNLLSDKL